MVLLTRQEINEIESIRKELCQANYLYHSHQTQKLWKIVNRKRNLKWFIGSLLNNK